MLTELFTNPLAFLFWALSLMVAVTIHEFAHAVTADRLGDPTPRLMGRITLNPLAHLDPIGTVAILIAGFGWGKPVVFDPMNLQNPRRDAAFISFAGPASNIVLALALAIIIRLFSSTTFFLEPFIYINIMLALFNLIPVHPLDGAKIVAGFLPHDQADEWDVFQNRYGIIMLLLILLPLTPQGSLVSVFLAPTLDFVFKFLVG